MYMTIRLAVGGLIGWVASSVMRTAGQQGHSSQRGSGIVFGVSTIKQGNFSMPDFPGITKRAHLSRVESDMRDLSATDQHPPQQNSLISALPAVECERLTHDLELIPLALGQVLYESGETMSHAYFPIDCIVSLLYVMKNGESAEIAIVGNEGMIGIALFMGGESTMSRAIVQNAGHAYRLKAKILKDEFDSGGALSRLLLMFASALITQMVQTAACNRHHLVDKQLCRWMLLSLDRLSSSRIRMTEKLIGNMLGLSPGDVTKATDVLQKAGLIHYNAGEITVLDRAGVEKRSCECYDVVKKESDRLLPLSVRTGQ